MTSTLAITAVASVAAFTWLWKLSLRRRDASIVDFYWGPGFVVIAWLAFALAPDATLIDLVFLAALTVWGARLGLYLVIRHEGGEDARYAAMRQRHGASFARRSLWLVFWLQAAVQWIASSPALVLFTTSARERADVMATPLSAMVAVAGCVMFAVGFALEAVADAAVRRFRADAANRGMLLTTGIHAHVRHPNYAGEILLQWGLGMIAFGATFNALAFVGPALMTFLIAKVSGVPLLEQEFAKRPGYENWRARTGALLPKLR